MAAFATSSVTPPAVGCMITPPKASAAEMAELVIRQRGEARGVLEVAHDADGAHARRRGLAHRLEHVDGAAVQVRRAMHVAVDRTRIFAAGASRRSGDGGT
jgi:hypothetical protein